MYNRFFMPMSFVAVLLIIKAWILLVESSTEPELLIYPNQDHIIAPIKETLILACEGKTREEDKTMDEEFKYEEEMFTNMKWLNEYGEEITENVTRSESMLKLTFTNPSASDSGKYKCTADYPSLSRILEAQVMLDFYELIKFEECPENQYLTLGETGNITCRAIASPMPMIIWKKDGRRLKSERIKIDEFVLTITSVNEKDMGIYTVEAFVKETGRNLIQNIHVNVITPPKINDLPEEFTVIPGENSTIKCEATGPEPLTYTWYNDRFDNLSDSDIIHSYFHKVDHGLLTISNVTRYIGKYYVCEVSNPAGIDRAAVKIKIQRSEICDKRCFHDDFSSNKFPKTKRDLRKACTIGIKNAKCWIQHREICEGANATADSSLEMNYEDLADFQEVFCSENTLFHAVLVENLKCLGKVVNSNTNRACALNDMDITESRIQKFLGVLDEKGLLSFADTWNDDIFSYEICTRIVDASACTAMLIENECGTIPMHVFITMLQKYMSVQRACEEFSTLLPEIIKIIKTEEEKERTLADTSLLDNFI